MEDVDPGKAHVLRQPVPSSFQVPCLLARRYCQTRAVLGPKPKARQEASWATGFRFCNVTQRNATQPSSLLVDINIVTIFFSGFPPKAVCMCSSLTTSPSSSSSSLSARLFLLTPLSRGRAYRYCHCLFPNQLQ